MRPDDNWLRNYLRYNEQGKSRHAQPNGEEQYPAPEPQRIYRDIQSHTGERRLGWAPYQSWTIVDTVGRPPSTRQE